MKVAPARSVWVAGLVAAAATVFGLAIRPVAAARPTKPARPVARSHLDHAPYFTQAFSAPQDVTRACLGCHPEAAREVMATAHWQWQGEEVVVPGHAGTHRVGKKNLLNNFCIGATGNEVTCMACHAGYGWADAGFDFSRAEDVDCLVCHERTGTYVKGEAGMPVEGTDLLAAARSVSFPRRENCGGCHNFGGGGQGVKHGDLDGSLDNPSDQDDVHMGRYGFLCIDCHRTEQHRIAGRSFSVSVEGTGGVACADCHAAAPHGDERIDAHLDALACQTCHVPTYARRLPTKTYWDWSKAGDASRPDDPHHYLRIKGEFLYDQDIVPEYFWFDRTVDRYLLGDRIDSTQVTDLNRPRGSIAEPDARVWPFKVHRATQPFDRQHAILLPPVTGGAGGYWQTFDWESALRLGAERSGVPFSGEYGFARTAMYWPLSHMVTPREETLACTDCHGDRSRLDWAALGYAGDPLRMGGRR